MPFTKQEREKHKSILMATLNYLLEFHSGDMVFDVISYSKMWYLREIKLAESYIKNYRSAQIKKRMDMHIALLRERYDQGLNDYIKAHTSYEIDIFAEYKAYVMPIVARGSLLVKDYDPNIEKYLKAYGTQPEEQAHVSLLKTLLAERQAELIRSDIAGETITVKGFFIVQGKKEFSVSEEEYKQLTKRGILSEETAPNGQYKLEVRTNGKGAYASTYVHIKLPGGEGGIYGARGDHLPIKAYWQDNNHIIIETKEEYENSFQYHQVTSYGELLKVEYRS